VNFRSRLKNRDACRRRLDAVRLVEDHQVGPALFRPRCEGFPPAAVVVDNRDERHAQRFGEFQFGGGEFHLLRHAADILIERNHDDLRVHVTFELGYPNRNHAQGAADQDAPRTEREDQDQRNKRFGLFPCHGQEQPVHAGGELVQAEAEGGQLVPPRARPEAVRQHNLRLHNDYWRRRLRRNVRRRGRNGVAFFRLVCRREQGVELGVVWSPGRRSSRRAAADGVAGNDQALWIASLVPERHRQ